MYLEQRQRWRGKPQAAEGSEGAEGLLSAFITSQFNACYLPSQEDVVFATPHLLYNMLMFTSALYCLLAPLQAASALSVAYCSSENTGYGHNTGT